MRPNNNNHTVQICIALNKKSTDALMVQAGKQAFKCLANVATVSDAIRRAVEITYYYTLETA